MTCWHCLTENDLSLTQTCAKCGAPLLSRGGFFREPWLLGVAVGLLVLQASVMLCVLALRGCR